MLLRGSFASQGRWALGDQVLSSGTNFGAAILVARLLGPHDYGCLAYAFGTWFTLLPLAKAALMQPYTLKASPLARPGWRRQTGLGATGMLLVGGGLCGILASIAVLLGVASTTGQAFAALALVSPALLLQEFWRAAGFSAGRARAVFCNDGVWAITQLVALGVVLAAHDLTPFSTLAAWGLGAAVAGVVGFVQFRVRPSNVRSGVAWLCETTRVGGWFGLSDLTYMVGSQGSVFLIGLLAGTASVGGLRSVMNLLGPAQLVTIAAESVALPAAARAVATAGPRAARRVGLAYSVVVCGAMTFYGVALAALGPHLLTLAFGSSYSPYASLVLPIALSFSVGVWAIGASITLRSLGHGRDLAGVNSLSTIVKLLLVLILGDRFGLLGATWALAGASAVTSGLVWAWHAKVVRDHSDVIGTDMSSRAIDAQNVEAEFVSQAL